MEKKKIGAYLTLALTDPNIQFNLISKPPHATNPNAMTARAFKHLQIQPSCVALGRKHQEAQEGSGQNKCWNQIMKSELGKR